MTQFPTLIDFIDSIGFDELHEIHNEDETRSMTFTEFCHDHYNNIKADWETEINNHKKHLDVPFNEENAICLESAKSVMTQIIDEGLRSYRVRDIILNDEMAPGYLTAISIIEDFRIQVIPAIERALNELGA